MNDVVAKKFEGKPKRPFLGFGPTPPEKNQICPAPAPGILASFIYWKPSNDTYITILVLSRCGMLFRDEIKLLSVPKSRQNLTKLSCKQEKRKRKRKKASAYSSVHLNPTIRLPIPHHLPIPHLPLPPPLLLTSTLPSTYPSSTSPPSTALHTHPSPANEKPLPALLARPP